jgi:hypothetical protein
MRPFSFFLLSTPRKKGANDELENPNLPRPKAGRGRQSEAGKRNSKKTFISACPLNEKSDHLFLKSFQIEGGLGEAPIINWEIKKSRGSLKNGWIFLFPKLFPDVAQHPFLRHSENKQNPTLTGSGFDLFSNVSQNGCCARQDEKTHYNL